MERLTERGKYNKTDISIKHEIPCSNYCTSCGRSDCDYIGAAIRRLAEYEDLEEQGRLIKLPCKVGDYIWDNDFGRPCSYEVTGFSFGNVNQDSWEDEIIFNQVIAYYTNSNGSITGSFAVSEIGKTVFLTREEAEEALQERNGRE